MIDSNICSILEDIGCNIISDPTEDVINKAKDAIKGIVYFYSKFPVQVGVKNIDWTGSHIKHQEWAAQLNRFLHLIPLACLYNTTKEEQFAKAARSYIEDWIDQNNSYLEQSQLHPGDNTLNLSIRLGGITHPGWFGLLPIFMESEAFDNKFIQKMCDSAYLQMKYLASNLTYEGNWRIAQLVSLLITGLRVPNLGQWIDFAVKGINDAFKRQVEEDGSHIEHTPSYHIWMTRDFTILWRLGNKLPKLGINIDKTKLIRMWDYALCSHLPDSTLVPLNDSHRGYGKKENKFFYEWRNILKELCLEERDLLCENNKKIFPRAGHIFIRTGWERKDTFLLFDLTRWGGGHCHLGKLGIMLYSGGDLLIGDPGPISYEMSNPLAPYGKSTRAHSTVNINGWNQSESNPEIIQYRFERDFSYIQARYTGGYWQGEYTWSFKHGRGRGIFGIHDRTLIWIQNKYILVLDYILADMTEASIEINWQLTSGKVIVSEDKRKIILQKEDASNLLITNIWDLYPIDVNIHEGEENPPRGWITDTPESVIPAPMVSWQGSIQKGAYEIGFLIFPFSDKEENEFIVERLSISDERTRACRIQWKDGKEDIIAWTSLLNTSISTKEITTDASFIFLSKIKEKVTNIFSISGTWLKYKDNEVYKLR